MAKSCTLLFGALVVLLPLVSPIACSRKLAKPNKHERPRHKPAVRPRSNYTATPSVLDAYGSGGWLSAGATYYGAPDGDGSDGGASGYRSRQVLRLGSGACRLQSQKRPSGLGSCTWSSGRGAVRCFSATYWPVLFLSYSYSRWDDGSSGRRDPLAGCMHE